MFPKHEEERKGGRPPNPTQGGTHLLNHFSNWPALGPVAEGVQGEIPPGRGLGTESPYFQSLFPPAGAGLGWAGLFVLQELFDGDDF